MATKPQKKNFIPLLYIVFVHLQQLHALWWVSCPQESALVWWLPWASWPHITTSSSPTVSSTSSRRWQTGCHGPTVTMIGTARTVWLETKLWLRVCSQDNSDQFAFVTDRQPLAEAWSQKGCPISTKEYIQMWKRYSFFVPNLLFVSMCGSLPRGLNC